MKTKIVFDKKVKSLIDTLSLLLDVKITFFSLDKEESLAGSHSNESDYCTLLQQQLDITPRCNKQDRKACTLCKAKNKRLIYQCHAGLTEIMIPIKSKELFAFAIIGQFRMHNTIPETIVSEWKAKGKDEEKLKRAFWERPLFSKEKTEAMADLLESIIALQVQAEELRIKRPEIAEQAYDYIDNNISSKISLKEFASEISKSESTITHKLTGTIGKSFQALVIDRKIEYFHKIIEQDPEISIKEASSRVGYQDPLYFSRIYKKKMRISPKEFRQSVRAK